jgi:hypothetical protein
MELRPLPVISLPTRSATTDFHTPRIMICIRNLLFAHHVQVVALTAVITVFCFAQRATATSATGISQRAQTTPYLASRAPLRQHMWQKIIPVN